MLCTLVFAIGTFPYALRAVATPWSLAQDTSHKELDTNKWQQHLLFFDILAKNNDDTKCVKSVLTNDNGEARTKRTYISHTRQQSRAHISRLRLTPSSPTIPSIPSVSPPKKKSPHLSPNPHNHSPIKPPPNTWDNRRMWGWL